MEDRLLTVEQVAARLQVPLSWIYRRTMRAAENRLPVTKIGKYNRVRESALEKWILQGSHNQD